MRPNGRVCGWKLFAPVAALVVAALTPCAAGVTVIFDAETLNDVLAASTVHQVQVPIAGSRTMTVFLEDLTVTDLVPAAGDGDADAIHTSLRVRVPALGLDVPVKPQIALDVTEEETLSVLELRFEEVRVPLPLGRIDIAPFLPPMRYPADAVFLLAGAQEDVRVRSRLAAVEMGEEAVRFELDLQVVPPDQP